MAVILCPKCLEIRTATKHHIFPQKFYRSNASSPLLFLCRECHNKLEQFLGTKKLSRKEYIGRAKAFLYSQDDPLSEELLKPIKRRKQNEKHNNVFTGGHRSGPHVWTDLGGC